ncbi:NAD(P)-binding domain-containing protein [Galbibacter sp. EGI 63066]|uniref:NADPH-dependent F420 reductase n=1 Tax=Galbibacter sp. EGI 63066 TaxID=2993559 RepID=UPI00224979FA|nr:NAD(P)-binding domain-containing protein [Galbibacter sp. EGI 63066]MCX2680256.1 NAD(P)-binding domain-containing protein [Galbibacter sp. EGI 63066]
MKIGIIGAGQIGSTLIRQYVKAGHEIKMTNASGIEKLKAIETETGAIAVSLADVVKNINVLIISIPFNEIPSLAKQLGQSIAADTIIVDTTNYYPIRDGKIDEVENGMLESVWVSNHLSRPVIKVYNSILAGSLLNEGLSKGSKNRIVLPISGDNLKSKETVASLVNDSGFDSIDIGDLSNSWKQQPGSPVYCTDLDKAAFKHNLDKAQRNTLAERREIALQFILKQDLSNWLSWYKDCVTNNRIVYKTALNN